MVDVVTWENSHRFGSALVTQHRLRHRVFIERQGWDIPSYRGMEYDQFDTPAAVYLIPRGPNGEVRGTTRLISTTRPYMIRELWPELIVRRPLPTSSEVWEGTRFGVEPDLSARERDRVIAELVLACLEFGLLNGIRQYLVLMPVLIIRRVFGCAGCTYEWLGQPRVLGRHRVAVAAIDVSYDALLKSRHRFRIHSPVLNLEHPDEEAA